MSDHEAGCKHEVSEEYVVVMEEMKLCYGVQGAWVRQYGDVS